MQLRSSKDSSAGAGGAISGTGSKKKAPASEQPQAVIQATPQPPLNQAAGPEGQNEPEHNGEEGEQHGHGEGMAHEDGTESKNTTSPMRSQRRLGRRQRSRCP